MGDKEDLKNSRSVWVRGKLDDYGLPHYGRATEISKDLTCSMSTVQGWLRGSLPRDLDLAYRASVKFDFDLVEWITLEKNQRVEEPAEESVVAAAVLKTKEFEKTLPTHLSPDTFLKVFMVVQKHLQGHSPSIDDSFNFVTLVNSAMSGES